MEHLSPTYRIDVIAFDADDTLWHNETLFIISQNRFKELLLEYHSEEWINKKLYETEGRNLQHFGYGVKGFTLSMIETAIELSEGRITGAEIQTIIEFGKDMLKAPVELLGGVRETIVKLSTSYELMLITKGDLFDQESKIARSGLGEYFSRIEVVREKDIGTYERITARHSIDPRQLLMVGNSLKSDILPVIAIGGRAVHIPYPSTWIHDMVTDVVIDQEKYFQIEHINLLPDLLEELNRT